MREISHDEQLTLVLGSAGKTGRRVAARLSERGRAGHVGSRMGTPPFEWGDGSTWLPVLQDVQSVYIHLAELTDGVQRGIGRPPTDFPEYARRTAAAGIWNPDRNDE